MLNQLSSGINIKAKSELNTRKYQNVSPKNIKFGESSDKFELTSKKKIAIVDDFTSPEVDINGDKIPDLAHGEVIKRLIKKAAPGVEIAEFDEYDTEAKGQNLVLVRKALIDIADKIDNGEKFEAVNISAGIGIDICDLAEEINRPVSFTNVQNYKKDIVNWLESLNNSEPYIYEEFQENSYLAGYNKFYADKCQDLKRKLCFSESFRIIKAIEKITQKGTPVYIAAGNEGIESLNLWTLADKAVSVGATDANGSMLAYFPMHMLVKKYAQGVFNISEVNDDSGKVIGYNITGDGTPEVMKEEVSKGESRVKNFINKPVKDFEITDKEFDILLDKIDDYMYAVNKNQLYTFNTRIPEIEKKIIPIDKFAQLWGLTTAKLSYMAFHGDYITLDGKLFLKEKDGLLEYDPDSSGRSDTINAIEGTSFATPMALIKDKLKDISFKGLEFMTGLKK